MDIISNVRLFSVSHQRPLHILLSKIVPFNPRNYIIIKLGIKLYPSLDCIMIKTIKDFKNVKV